AALFRPRILKLEGDPCRAIRGVVVGTVGLLWLVFTFTARPPVGRNYYILCPVAFLTGYLAFGSLIQSPRARRWAAGVLAAGAIFHVGVATQRLKMNPWDARRGTVMRAIQERDYRVLAERRPRVRY